MELNISTYLDFIMVWLQMRSQGGAEFNKCPHYYLIISTFVNNVQEIFCEINVIIAYTGHSINTIHIRVNILIIFSGS